MPSPGNQFLSDEFGDIEDYFVTDYWLIDQYIGDRLWGIGANTQGQLGINAATNRSTPVTTLLGGTNWVQSSCGDFFTAAIKEDGSLWLWGGGSNGVLGNNVAPAGRTTPVTTILGGTNWKQVSSGVGIVASVKKDGTLWTWGNNSNGSLGINKAGNSTGNAARSTPVTTLSGGTNWNSVSCGNHMAAIKTDGTLWTWGLNSSGQLGLNDSITRSAPVTTILGGTDWKSVACGDNHTVAIKNDGTLWAWGSNAFGQLGVNDITSRLTPSTIILNGTYWRSISCGQNHTIAIKTDGSLWTWGRNTNGQLGINNTTDRSTPVTTILGGFDWKSSGEGYWNTSAIKTNGTLWLWGYNGVGTLGINNITDRSTPVTTILGGNNWKSVSGGNAHIVAVQSGESVDLS